MVMRMMELDELQSLGLTENTDWELDLYIDPYTGEFKAEPLMKSRDIERHAIKENWQIIAYLYNLAMEREKINEEIKILENELKTQNLTPRQRSYRIRKIAKLKTKKRELDNSFFSKLYETPAEYHVFILDHLHKKIYQSHAKNLNQAKKKKKEEAQIQKVIQYMAELQKLNPIIQIKPSINLIRSILKCNQETAKRLKIEIEKRLSQKDKNITQQQPKKD